MRLHIELENDLVDEVDAVAGHRGRTRFVRDAIKDALAHRKQRALIRSARGSIKTDGHDWQEDPAAWVRNQRRVDTRKVG